MHALKKSFKFSIGSSICFLRAKNIYITEMLILCCVHFPLWFSLELITVIKWNVYNDNRRLERVHEYSFMQGLGKVSLPLVLGAPAGSLAPDY